jgi:hypothetical protein
MKTIIELPDDLAREAQARGARAGKDLKEMLAEGLRLVLALPEPVLPPHGSGEGETRAATSCHDLTAWDRLRAAYQSPFPGRTAMEMIDEFRGPVELPPTAP